MKVDVEGLAKAYGSYFELQIPQLQIGSGESFGLVGNNGAGKTTFLRLLLDLVAPDRGRILLDGTGVAGRDEWKRYVGSYVDESFLLDFLTTEEYFDFVGATYGMSRSEIRAAVSPFRSLVGDGMLDDRRRYIRDLSVGNRKKIGLVAAMFVRPRLLIVDEPFANLDPGSQLQLLRLLRDLRTKAGTTLVLSSHDLEYVTRICERVAVLEDGRIRRDIQTSDGTLPHLRRYFEARLHGS